MNALLVAQTILFLGRYATGLPEPVAFWPLNGRDLLNDRSGNGNHGTAGPSVILRNDAESTKAGAYYFDGRAGSYIDLPNNGAYDTRRNTTVAMYIYPEYGSGTLFSFGRDQGTGVTMAGGAGILNVQYLTTSGRTFVHSTTRVPAGRWSFVGFTYTPAERGRALLYVNDVIVHNGIIGDVELATDGPVRIGGSGFQGLITCVQVYNAEFLSEQMFETRKECNMGSRDGLNPVAFWPLDGEHSLQDLSGNGNHGEAGSDVEFVESVEGTRSGAYRLKGNLHSYLQFPNNGAYDTRRSMTVLMYHYGEWAVGPMFSFDDNGQAVRMLRDSHNFNANWVRRDTLQNTRIAVTPVWYNFWNWVGLSYDYDTGYGHIINRYGIQQSVYLGQVELATNFEASRVGAVKWLADALVGHVTCLQIYDRQLTEAEIFEASEMCSMGSSSRIVEPTTLMPTPAATTKLPTEEPTTTPAATTEVCVVPSGLSNAAQRREASQISNAGRFVAGYAVDGNKNSDFKQKSCSKTGKRADPWWKVDLGSSQDVYQVTITNRQDCCAKKLVNAEVRVGDSSNIARNDICGAKLSMSEAVKETIEVVCDCGAPVRGRYVSVQLVGVKDALTLCEVEVMTDDGTPLATDAVSEFTTEEPCILPDNVHNVITPSTRVSQSSTMKDHVASRAVDGNKNTNLFAGGCAMTRRELEPVMKVDLGAIRKVHKVVITNRQDCCGFRLKGVVLRLGNSVVPAENPVCGNGALRRVNFPAVEVVCGCEVPMRGRHLSLTLVDKTQLLTVCELEVFAAP